MVPCGLHGVPGVSQLLMTWTLFAKPGLIVTIDPVRTGSTDLPQIGAPIRAMQWFQSQYGPGSQCMPRTVESIGPGTCRGR